MAAKMAPRTIFANGPNSRLYSCGKRQHLASGVALWDVQKVNEFRSHNANKLPELRNPLAELFQALHDGPDYSTQLLNTQLAVWLRNEKVGGLNLRRWHFYISKVFVRNYGSSELLKDHDFALILHSRTHQYWKLDGAERHQLFRAVIEEMTGCPINVR